MLRIIGILILFLAILPAYVFLGGPGAIAVFGLMLMACYGWFEDGVYVASSMAMLSLVFFALVFGA